MEHIQKDDIIIRKGILHILDSHTGYLGLSSQLLEMGPDLMEFVRGHIFKIMESDDAKRCQFDGSVSPVLSLLERPQESLEKICSTLCVTALQFQQEICSV